MAEIPGKITVHVSAEGVEETARQLEKLITLQERPLRIWTVFGMFAIVVICATMITGCYLVNVTPFKYGRCATWVDRGAGGSWEAKECR